MSVTRRQFLSLSAIAAASATLGACAPARTFMQQAQHGDSTFEPLPDSSFGNWQTLRRLTYAPHADEVARANEIGSAAWVEEQLAPETIDDTAAELATRGLDTLWMDADLLLNVRQEAAKQELQRAALLRAIYSRRQLYETMVEFWSDHFNIAQDKLDCAWLKTVDDREVIRKHALGNFYDLLWASMHSPAMLHYLDNQENFKDAPNENYARELLELHSLGVDAGYTQRDVRETARCLTGWSVNHTWRRGQFEFQPAQHDDAEKIVLGMTLPANGGEQDGERLFEAIRAHPALPRFIARKLVRRLVSDEPPPALVSRTAAVFSETHGDIRATLRVILFSDEFQHAPPKFKRPLHIVAGALRQLNVETNVPAPLLEHLARMGQPLFQWAMPDGFPDRAAAWQNNLLARWQFALAFASDEIQGVSVNWNGLRPLTGDGSMRELLQNFSQLLFGIALPKNTLDELVTLFRDVPSDHTARVALAVTLAAPQYQWK